MTLDEAKERTKNLAESVEIIGTIDEEALKIVLARLEQLEAMQRFAESNSQNLYD